jgi:acyl-ACP thioesterase
MLDPSIPVPASGRTYSSHRRVRLSDMDVRGRVRLDAIARFLQDVAIDDVQETGWGMPDHLWFVRSMRIDVLQPFVDDREVTLTTWCSGVAAIAAGRRWSVSGDAGGSIEVDSVWIHLDGESRPARIEGFSVYADSSAGRHVSTKLHLADPPSDALRLRWPLRATDLDLHGHVNNAVYWQAVEDVLAGATVDLRAPMRAELDFREPIDHGEPLELVTAGGTMGFAFGESVRAVARLTSI